MNAEAADLLARVAALLGDRVDDRTKEARVIIDAAGSSEERALAIAEARANGKPLGYLLGRTRFMGIDLAVGPGALVPREETELLGNTALEVLTGLTKERGKGGEIRVIDMCCGSGNLACALASHLPEIHAWGSDLTDGTVALARENVERLGLLARVHIAQGDLFASLAGLGLEGTVDVIVCNPPYISTSRLGKDRAALLDHEPREAFDGGPYGVSIQQRVIKDALAFLRPSGFLMFEIGAGQERQVELLFKRARAYEGVEQRCDRGGAPRVILGKKTG